MTAPRFPESSKLPDSIAMDERKIDPQNQTPETKWTSARKSPDRTLIVILGAFFLLGGGWIGWSWLTNNQKGNSASEQRNSGFPAMPVKLAEVETGTVSESLEVLGTLEASRSVTLRAEVSGRISQIPVKEGERVRRGQAIALIDSEDLQAQLLQTKAARERAKARLAELEAGNRSEDIAIARANLKQTEARLANAKSGSSPEGVAQAKARLDSAKAEADLAKERVARYRALEREGAISQDRFREYLKEERSAIASMEEAERYLAERQKEQQYRVDELAATVEGARQNLKEVENGSRPEQIAQARAELAEAIASARQIEVRIERTRVVAPFSGIIGDIPGKIGDYIAQGSELSTLTENDSLEIDLQIPVERSANLRSGLPVEILDPAGKTLRTGKITFISPNVTDNAQLIQAKATFTNVDGKLRNGQSLRARVIWSRHPGLLVPTIAIARLGGENFVFVAEEAKNSEKPQLVARQKTVKLGSLQGNYYEVLAGLNSQEKIVISGILNLRDGAPIAVEK